MPGESCQECAYLVGHAATCSKAKQDPETAGWNAGLEAAAKVARAAERENIAALILTLKK